jgi:hypothetical protein
MPKLKGGLKARRTIPVFFRVSEWENQELLRREKAANLSRAAYFRCKGLDIPFEVMGGRSVPAKEPAKPTVHVPTNPTP